MKRLFKILVILTLVLVSCSTQQNLTTSTKVLGSGIKYDLLIEENLTKYEKLKFVQELFNKGDSKTKLIFKDLGYLLADFISYLSRFIKIENVILLGRVLSNNSGKYIYECVLNKLSNDINVYLPDEHFVRIGQAVSVANIVKKY